MAAYTFDARLNRYRGPSGRFVTEREMQDVLVKLSDASGARMAALTTRLQSGSLKLADWQVQMMAEVKQVHLAAAMAGHGGQAMMAPADNAAAGQYIRQQYQYLQAWAQDITNGSAPLDRRLVSRSRLYATSSLSTFDGMRERDARNSGAAMQEMNRSHSKDPCLQCPGLSAQGWVSLGTLPPVGSRACVSNCRCVISRRIVPAAESAA